MNDDQRVDETVVFMTCVRWESICLSTTDAMLLIGMTFQKLVNKDALSYKNTVKDARRSVSACRRAVKELTSWKNKPESGLFELSEINLKDLETIALVVYHAVVLSNSHVSTPDEVRARAWRRLHDMCAPREGGCFFNSLSFLQSATFVEMCVFSREHAKQEGEYARARAYQKMVVTELEKYAPKQWYSFENENITFHKKELQNIEYVCSGLKIKIHEGESAPLPDPIELPTELSAYP